jgi:hypothetical protein
VPEQFEKNPLFADGAPADLTVVPDNELQTLEAEGIAEFDRVDALPEVTPDMVSYALNLREDLDRVKAELSARKVRADQQAAAQKARSERQMAELSTAIHGAPEGTPEAAAAATADLAKREDAIAAAAAKGATAAVLQVFERRAGSVISEAAARNGVASLGATAAQTPKPKAPQAKLAITASGSGQELPNLAALGQAFNDKAKDIPASNLGSQAPRHPVARIANTFEHTVDSRTSPYEVEEVWNDLTSRDKQDALVAGGGWCAPNEIVYNFFNIADAPSGLIDLPTVGVTRGGIQFPVSPAIGDVFFGLGGSNPASGFGGFAFPFSNASDPWLWSETDDILTVTGSVNKPTLRVPCSTFNSARLEAYGLTVTAGNLTDSAYPEQTQNFIRLLRAAYAHAINARLIGLMVSASTAFSGLGGGTQSAFNSILDGVELAATDYRNKFAMADDAVLEVVLPRFTLAIIRADLAWRTAVERESVSDAQIRAWFTDRGVRAQFVSDWQVRGSGQFGANVTTKVTWGTTVTFMIYAAGTFLHGQGMSLDLGVVRDSLLNAENDFTAAWAEETHLIAKVGHESRTYQVTYGVNGAGVAAQSNASYL